TDLEPDDGYRHKSACNKMKGKGPVSFASLPDGVARVRSLMSWIRSEITLVGKLISIPGTAWLFVLSIDADQRATPSDRPPPAPRTDAAAPLALRQRRCSPGGAWAYTRARPRKLADASRLRRLLGRNPQTRHRGTLDRGIIAA